MMLLEHDAKELLAGRGIAVPSGFLATAEAIALANLPSSFPLIVKAQVATGGRGKAGGIRRVDSRDALRRVLLDLQGFVIKGHTVRTCRVEEPIAGTECYVSFSLDPSCGRLTCLMSADGGVDIEAHADDGALLTADCAFTQGAALAAASELARRLPEPAQRAIRDAAPALIAAFFELEATLLEINPLFVRADGSFVAGDVKLIIDDNALARHPGLVDLVLSRRNEYPELALKLDAGFDFIELDSDGEIGLVTTGAGLSMQLIDELAARGHSAFNFCDIRTGQLRGDPTRLIQVLRWIAAGRNVRSVLINFFAGITHLGEISHLLVAAMRAVPELRAPIVARLIGNGYDEAFAVLAASGSALRVEPDLDKAIDLAVAPLAGPRR